MKLLRCYIENFGTLSQYSADFSDGLTVINENNGFGKTTLAVFLRTMFYGFPRSNKTDLNKDLRRKYLPWQGGKFGGNIEFECDGITYRLERFFGEKPSQDTFTLYELDPLRKCDAFSKNIGIELFGLDADSFERSTYMPQQHDTAPLSTGNIQAKLGNLMEDTNDINNFDKAMERLKKARSAYIPYRGNGGSVAAAIQKISALQNEQSDCMASKSRIPALQEQCDELTAKIKDLESSAVETQHEITRLSQLSAQEALLREKQGLLRRQDSCQQALSDLTQRYPKGLPSEETLSHISSSLDDFTALSADDPAAQSYRESCAVLEENDALVSAGIPSRESVLQQQQSLQQYQLLRTQQAQLQLSDREEHDYASLKDFFAAGAPNTSALSEMDTLHARLLEKQSSARSTQFSPSEELELEQLSLYFHETPPSEQEMAKFQQQASQITALQQENELLAAAEIPAADTSKSAAFLPCLIAGLLAISGGIALFVMKNYSIGGLLAGLGVILAIVAIYTNLRHMISGNVQRDTFMAQQKTKMELNSQHIAQLQHLLGTELAPFLNEGCSFDKTLQILTENRRRYLELNERKDRLHQLTTQQQAEISQLEIRLQQFFVPYFSMDTDLETACRQMKDRQRAYLALQEKAHLIQTRRDELEQECISLEKALAAFFQPYSGIVAPKDFAPTLADLNQRWDALRHAQHFTQTYRRQLQQRELTQKELLAEITAFFADFEGISADRNGLQQIHDDVLAQQRLLHEQTLLAQQLEDFTAKHGTVAEVLPQEAGNMGILQQKAQQLRQEISSLTQEQLQLQQQLAVLCERADLLPALDDEIEYWREKKDEDMQKAALLDATMSALQEAKESLSGTYLKSIKSRFVFYLAQLNENAEQSSIFMDHNLAVRLERGGEARELDCFSAGYTDMIMICMRLALIDALFEENVPFLILDDPFVNLDDLHTKKALELLQQLSSNHQIIYLVCHSSRC